MQTPRISTPRLILTPLEPSDAPAMFEYRSDPDVCRFQGYEPASLGDTEAFLAEQIPKDFLEAGQWHSLAIRLQESTLLIGDIALRIPAQKPQQAEIGFTLAPSHQGQGYATEAVSALLTYLLVTLQKHRVFASVDPRNQACLSLLRRVGMRQEAHFRQSLWFKGEWTDDVVFGILRAEWANRLSQKNDLNRDNPS